MWYELSKKVENLGLHSGKGEEMRSELGMSVVIRDWKDKGASDGDIQIGGSTWTKTIVVLRTKIFCVRLF